MTYKATVEKWLSYPELDAELKQQLISMQHNEKALEDGFYKNLEFGTGGMRGEIGPGTNRMNIYTIRKASEGLARYIVEQGEEAKARGVVIAYCMSACHLSKVISSTKKGAGRKAIIEYTDRRLGALCRLITKNL